MIKNNMTVKIGGEAGMGVESGGAGLTKALTRGGLYVFAYPDYMSRIRGGHNFYQIRVSTSDVWTFSEEVHLLLAFTRECIDRHWHEVVKGGGIIYDEALTIDAGPLRQKGIKPMPMPLSKIATEVGGHRIMTNTCALGATAGVTGYDFERIRDILQTNFQRKGSEIVEKNLAVAKAGYDYAESHYAKDFEFRLEAVGTTKRMVINGNEAIGMGALAAGCRFISAYPMTPATTIFEYINKYASEYGVVTKQTEDELAAILFAIGANHAGTRAMTCTSGGGFSLMAEALGLAGITETPLVLAEVQRGGPSTGLPTRTEQPDLEFIIHASHGEFPRFVLAPGTPEQCFETAVRAFNLAEKYQTPVIIISDMHLSNAVRSVDPGRFDFKGIKIDRGELLTDEQLNNLTEAYKRHKLTESGISPRAIPSHPNGVYITTSDEHTEEGQAAEDVELRVQMMQKRMKKTILMERDMRAPQVYGDANADITLMGWGSTYGPLREAVDHLKKEGIKANFLQFIDIWPFPVNKVKALLDKARYTVCIENNYTGQLANVIRQMTGYEVNKRINKYTGRPFLTEEIMTTLKEEVHVHV